MLWAVISKDPSRTHSFSLFKAEASRYGTLHRHQSLFPRQTLLINLSPSSQFNPTIFPHSTSHLLWPVSHQLELREINTICHPCLRKKSRGKWGNHQPKRYYLGKINPKECPSPRPVVLTPKLHFPKCTPDLSLWLPLPAFQSYEKDLRHPYCAPTLSSYRTRLV